MDVNPTLIGVSRSAEKRGGIKDWTTVRGRIVNNLKDQRELIVSTMVDYYGLRPRSGPNAWPGCQPHHKNISSYERADSIHHQLFADVEQAIGGHYLRNRFIPYVVMHEFEGLLFSDCTQMVYATGRYEKLSLLADINSQFQNPEEINDNVHSAPSKRLQQIFGNGFEKVYSIRVAKAIGITGIRSACPVFADWISRLEQWPQNYS